MIMYSHNKSYKWLRKQPSQYREKLLKAARTLAPSIRNKFLERRDKLLGKCQECLLQKQKEVARKELKVAEEKEYSTKQKGNYWIMDKQGRGR